MNDWATYRSIAQAVCTPAELEVWLLRVHGMSQWSVALATGRSRSTIRTLEQRARQKITTHPDFTKEPAA